MELEQVAAALLEAVFRVGGALVEAVPGRQELVVAAVLPLRAAGAELRLYWSRWGRGLALRPFQQAREAPSDTRDRKIR